MTNNYIVIEGLEGSGKTTVTNLVADILKDLGVKDIILTYEPGGTYLSEKLRNLILEVKSLDKETISDKVEVLMFYAARVQLIETIIKPALRNGSWIISDRNDLSTQAYQGGGRGIDQKILKTLKEIFIGDFHPSLTIYLDITPEVGLKRINARGKLNRIELESMEFFNKVRKRYLELIQENKTIYRIDATQTLESVSCDIRNLIISWFKRRQ